MTYTFDVKELSDELRLMRTKSPSSPFHVVSLRSLHRQSSTVPLKHRQSSLYGTVELPSQDGRLLSHSQVAECTLALLVPIG